MAVALTRAMRRAGICLIVVVLLGTAGWGVLALAYFDHAPGALRLGFACAFALLSLTTLFLFLATRFRWWALAANAALFSLLLWRWEAIEPSNDRDWLAENAVLSSATLDGENVTVHNIRNFDYRSESDFTPAHYDRTFDLRRLEGADLVAVYWMGPAIAHVFLSFAFSGGEHLAISIEARKERGEGYSTLRGFFRQYELIYIVADERDVIRLRTSYRRDPPEQVHVYRLQGTAVELRQLFLDYMREINALAEQPEFYNSLTTNCTSNAWLHSRVNPEHVPYSWQVLASGYLPRYLYDIGRLDTRVPFDELERRSVVNARARAADHAADFSALIRRDAARKDPSDRVDTNRP